MRDYQFGAFISYRRGGDDEAVAKVLHRLLEKFHTPKRLVKAGVPARVGRVYLDTAEREAAPSLDEAIHADLEASRWLIVVCSKRTPDSSWVSQEISRFAATSPDRVLALLIDGEPEQSYPPVLMKLGDPRAADIRGDTRQKMLARLRKTEKLALLAPILGVRYDDLKARELQRRRHLITTISTVSGVLVTVLAALSLMVRSERLKMAMSEALERFTTQSIMALENEDDSTTALFLARISYLYNQQNEMEKTALIDKTLRRILGTPHLNTTLFTDEHDISTAVISPDGRWLAITGDYPTIRVFDLEDISHAPREVSHDHLNVRHLAFGPDSRQLMGVEETGKLLVWTDIVSDGRSQAARLQGLTSFSESVISADVQKIAAGTHDGRILLWQTEALGPAMELYGHSGIVSSLAFNPKDSKVIASGGYDGSVQIWTGPENEAQQKFLLDSPVTAIAFSDDGASLAIGTKGKIFTADLDAMSPRGNVYLLRHDSVRYSDPTLLGNHKGSVEALQFSPDGLQVASAGSGDGVVKLWDLLSGTGPDVLSKHPGILVDVLYGRDGSYLYSVDTGDKGVQPARVKLWHLGKPFAAPEILEYHDGAIHALEFIPGKPLLASVGGYDGAVIIHDVNRGECIRRYLTEEYSYESLAVAPLGQHIFTAGRMFLTNEIDFGVRQWNIGTESAEPERIFAGHESAVIALAVSSDERRLASAATSDNNIRLWNLDQVQTEGPIWDTEESGVLDLEFRPGSHELAWAGDSAFVHVADIKDRSTEREWLAHRLPVSALQFSSDGNRLFSGSLDGTIKLWDLSASLNLPVLTAEQTSPVSALSFDNIGNTLASGGEDGVVRLWFINESTDDYSELRETDSKILSLDFNHDGKYLAAGDADNRIYLWRTLEELAGQACTLVGRNPTPDEWSRLVNGADGDPEYGGERCICFPESPCD